MKEDEGRRKAYPVKIIVPAGRVVPLDRKLTIFGTEKMRSLYVVFSLGPHEMVLSHGKETD
jgi:hypothetical protein